MVAYTGFKAYLPAFWSLPSLFLTGPAAAGSIGLINSVGNLGGFMGPFVIGTVEKLTGSFISGLLFLVVSMALSAGHRALPGPEGPGASPPAEHLRRRAPPMTYSRERRERA